jgi:anti-anti-sigma factor
VAGVSEGVSVPAPGFDVEVRPSGDSVRIVPTGELDIATADRLREVLRDQEAPSRSILLDLGELDFIDVSGLRVVREEQARAERVGFTLRVAAGSGAARRLLELIDATERFPGGPS